MKKIQNIKTILKNKLETSPCAQNTYNITKIATVMGAVMLPPPQRSYFLWLIIGICTFGIGYLVYYYNNFSDMKKLSNMAASKSGAMSSSSDPFLGLIIMLICAPIGIIFKYNQLNDMINMSGAQMHEPRPPSGALALILFICGFGIGALYAEAKWQSAMNYHAMNLSR